jgi:ATP-dependent DNA helicase DinG
VPALQSNGKVIVSTGTKTLQDQLFNKDLPMVRDILKAPVKIALLKGRANTSALPPAALAGRRPFPDQRRRRRRPPHLGLRQDHADRRQGRMRRGPENSPVWNSHLDARQLPGPGMPGLQGMLRHAARGGDGGRPGRGQSPPVLRRRHAARRGMAELLPACNTVIFDEAHQLPEVATLFFGDSVSTAQVVDLARDTRAEA